MAHELMPLLYGRQPVLEALQAKAPIKRILLAAGMRTLGPIADICTQAEAQGITVQHVPRKSLDRFASANHQGVAAEIAPYPYVNLETILRSTTLAADSSPLLLVLDCLQDIQNFGSLLRTAEATGVHGIILPKRRSVSVTPALYKTSAGAVQYLQIARVPNLVRAMERIQQEGMWVLGVDNTGETSYGQTDLRGPLAVVVGAEGKGLRRLVREKCDLRIRLPMRGHIDSLNVSVAGSVILYEVWRQRNTGHGHAQA